MSIYILGICILLVIIIIGSFQNIVLEYEQFIQYTLREHIDMTFINRIFYIVTTINSYNKQIGKYII